MSNTDHEQERPNTPTITKTSHTVVTENNPAYGITLESRGTRPLVPQPYEDIDLQEGVKEYTSLRVTDHDGAIYQTLVPSKTPSTTSSTKVVSTNKLALFVTLVTTVIVVSLIVIMGVIIAVLHTTASNESYLQDIKTLQKEVQTLREIANRTSQENVNNFYEEILSKIDQLNTTTDTQLDRHLNKVLKLQTTMESLANQVNNLTVHVNSSHQVQETRVAYLETAVGTITNQVNSLQSSVDTVTTRINSSVNIYQNCIKDTTSCEGSPLAQTSYRRACITPTLPINTTVSGF